MRTRPPLQSTAPTTTTVWAATRRKPPSRPLRAISPLRSRPGVEGIEVEIFQNINIKYFKIFSSQEEGEEAGGREEGGLQAADSKAKTCHLVINQSGASIESADPVLVSDWSSPSSSIPTHHHQLPPQSQS